MTASPPAEAGQRTAVALALAALALAGTYLGPMAGASARLAASVLLALVAAAALLEPNGSGARPRVRFLTLGALLVFITLVVTRSPRPEGPLAGASLALLLTAMAARRPGLSHHLTAVGAAGLALTGYELLTSRWPPAWRGMEAVARATTAALGHLSGAGTSLGPSVAGVPVILLFLAYLAAVGLACASRERGRILLAAAWVVLVGAAGWAFGIPLSLRAFNDLLGLASLSVSQMGIPGFPASVAVHLPLALFGACLAPTLALAAGPLAWLPGREGAAPLRWRRVPQGAGPALAAALATLAACLPPVHLPGPEERPEVALLDRGMVQWSVPSRGALGLERAGMFGMLSRYLETAGFRVTRSREALSEESLGASRVVVIINPTGPIPAAERTRLERFVKDGGGLLVLGDHTDIEGSMAPLNELLDPYGVAFRFDSAFTPRHWHNDAGFFPGPLTRRLDDSNNRLQQSTGASLALGSGAAPVAIARWGFSDAGNRANAGNAFLGDYIYEAGEPMGDLPVVAMTRHGRGRVIVFGDTSSFQNIALPFSFQFIARAFQTAAGRDLPAARGLLPFGLSGWIVLAIVMGLRRGRRGLAGLLAGTVLGLCSARPLAILAEPERPVLSSRVALVDAAHCNDVSMETWDDDALSGLNMNLARNGFVPLVDREASEAWLRAAELYVTVAPRRRFSGAEMRRLRALTERGGEVVLAVGWEEKSGSRELLGMAGFDVAPMPLGPVPVLRKIDDEEVYRRLQIEPHFREAWPVEGARPGQDEVIYEAYGHPVVVRRRVGAGGFTLIADSMFLLNRTLEEEGAAWEGNATLLRRILRGRDTMAATGAGR